MRLVLSLVALLCLAATRGFALVGAELDLSYWKIGASDMVTTLDADEGNPAFLTGSGSVSEHFLGLGGSAFLETDDDLRLGVSAGADELPGASLNLAFNGGQYAQKFNLSAVEVPVSVYLKRMLGYGHFSIFGGAGVTYVTAGGPATFTTPQGSVSGTFSDSIWAPHIVAGGEWFFKESFALELGVRYVLMATMKDFEGDASGTGNFSNGHYSVVMSPSPGYPPQSMALAMGGGPAGARNFQQDFSGARINLGVRYYFGGGTIF